MENNDEYKQAISNLSKLQEQQTHLSEYSNNKDTTYQEVTKLIGLQFDACVKALEARRVALLREAEEKFKEQEITIVEKQNELEKLSKLCKDTIDSGSLLYNLNNHSAAENVWKGASTISCKVMGQLTASFRATFYPSIEYYGTVSFEDPGAKNLKRNNNPQVQRSKPTATPFSKAGTVTTFAGVQGEKLSVPIGLCYSSLSDCLFVCDYENHLIRKITPNGLVSSFVSAKSLAPFDVDIFYKENALFVSNADHTILKITQEGNVYELAGAGKQGMQDGTRGNALFNQPRGIAVDQSTGNVYVCDNANHIIRKITPQGFVSTIAGMASTHGHADGKGSVARFSHPVGISFEQSSQSLIVCDSQNNKLRRVTLDGEVSTLCEALNPLYNCLASDGSILFTTGVRNKIMLAVLKEGEYVVDILAGNSSSGDKDGEPLESTFKYPFGIALDEKTNSCFVADGFNNKIRKISLV